MLDGFGGQFWPKIGRERPPSSAKTRPGFVQALVLATEGSLQAYVLSNRRCKRKRLHKLPPARELARFNFMLKNIFKLLERKLHSGIQKHTENQILILAKMKIWFSVFFWIREYNFRVSSYF